MVTPPFLYLFRFTHSRLGILGLVLGFTPFAGWGQEFESPPPLKAADLLAAGWLKSDLHTVAPDVVAAGLLDRFTVQTSQGSFEVEGREMLQVRIRELHALAALGDQRLVGAAVKGLVEEGGNTLKTVGGAVKKPVRTVFNIPKGLVSLGKRSAGSIGEKVKEGGNYTGGPVKDWFRVSEKRLGLAAKLGVDPYTDNEALAKEMDKLAGSAAVGGIGLRLLVPGDGLISAANAGEDARSLNDVALTPPTQLFQENLKMLTDLGVTKERASQFLGHPIYSPIDQSLIVRAIAGFPGIAGVSEFLDGAEMAANRAECVAFRRGTEWLRAEHDRGTALVALGQVGGHPAGLSQSKLMVLPVYGDHAYWTPQAAEALENLAEARRATGCEGILILTSVDLSARLRKELTARGIRVTESKPG